MRSVLYVRLPCWKIYPVGLVSIADYIHKHRPGIRQRIIELSLVEPRRRRSYLEEEIRKYRPDVIAFSWRDIQTFTPHDGTPSLEAVLKWSYSRRLKDKISSAFTAAVLVVDFVYHLCKNISYIWLAHRLKPDAQIVVGGTAFSCFPDHLIRRLPEGTIGVVGEGERAMLKILEGKGLEDESVVYMRKGRLFRHRSRGFIDLTEFTPTDFPYIAEIFPQFHSFLDGDIGVQTKRGCPYRCVFCLYNVIEGRVVRWRRPAVVARDVVTLAKRYGVKRIWFTDSQFIPTKGHFPVVEETLDRLISEKLDISWTTYLRIEDMTASMARKLLQSGIRSFDLTFTGSQRVIDSLELGYSLDRQIEGFRRIKEAGFRDQLIKLYMPLNAPGETPETLLETIRTCRLLYGIFGRERVHPWLFFLAVQSGTPLEKRLIQEGYLKPGYNPLSCNPFTIKRLLYNPPPLGDLIGQSFLRACTRAKGEERDRLTLEILEETLGEKGNC